MDLGIGRILVETDAQEVVRAIRYDDYHLLSVGNLIDEIKSLACSSFISFELVHVSRECNRAAHELAVLGYLCNEGRSWSPTRYTKLYL